MTKKKNTVHLKQMRCANCREFFEGKRPPAGVSWLPICSTKCFDDMKNQFYKNIKESVNMKKLAKKSTRKMTTKVSKKITKRPNSRYGLVDFTILYKAQSPREQSMSVDSKYLDHTVYTTHIMAKNEAHLEQILSTRPNIKVILIRRLSPTARGPYNVRYALVLNGKIVINEHSMRI